jgi:hypothetical protein
VEEVEWNPRKPEREIYLSEEDEPTYEVGESVNQSHPSADENEDIAMVENNKEYQTSQRSSSVDAQNQCVSAQVK